MINTSQWTILRSPSFFPLFITQFLGAFNDNVFKNALVMLITYQLGNQLGLNPQIVVTLAAGLFILPFFLFSATAGQLADKYEKSTLIKWIKLVEVILMVLSSIAFHCKNISMLLTVLFFLGIQASFFGPLKYAIIPSLLPKNELIAGNGLIEAATFVAILLGTILGGVLVLLHNGIYFISIATILFSVLGFIASLYLPKVIDMQPTLSINYNIITETSRVIRYAKQRLDIFVSIIGISWFWFVGAIYLAEFPVFAKDILSVDQYVVTLFMVTFTIGIAIGSLCSNIVFKGKIIIKWITWLAFGMSVFPIDLYYVSAQWAAMLPNHLLNPIEFLSHLSAWRIVLDLLLMAMCGGLYTVPLYAILQDRSEASHRARVIASNNVMNALFMVIASIFTMAMLKAHYTVIDIFLWVAIINIVMIVYIRLRFPN